MLHFLILSGWLSVYITSALTTMDGGDLKRQELIKTAIRQSDVPNAGDQLRVVTRLHSHEG